MSTHTDDLTVAADTPFPFLELVGLDGDAVPVPDPGRTVHLQLRRFAGCPICNLHLRSFVARADEISAAGIAEVVVFHSTPDALRDHVADLPFTLVADPTRQIYRRLGAETSARALLDPRLLVRLPRILLSAIRGVIRPPHRVPPMRPTGGQLGTPADFLIAGDGRVIAVKYGEHAYDQWSVDELLGHAEGHADV